MSSFFTIIGGIAGIALLYYGAEWLIKGGVSIALKMQESAGNEYKGEILGGFDIRIEATQLDFESDSFDDTYDEDAEY